MLCQFTVKNFQCIKDEVTLDMQATNISEHQSSVLNDADGESFLPLCAVYGPNGGGKTTILKALFALARKIIMPICAITCDNTECVKNSTNILIEPFAFSKETAKAPTEFEVFFRTHSHEYKYSLSVAKDKVIYESLYKKAVNKDSNSRYTLVFERKNLIDITLRGSLKSYDVAGISDTLTLLSYFGITHRRNQVVKDVINWFDNQIEFINYGNPNEEAHIPVVEKTPLKQLILKMLAEMDIDISDYRIDKKEDRSKVFTKHTVQGVDYELPFASESNGTIKAFGILPYVATSITEGTTLVVDELDAKLHPQLLKYFIQLYSNPKINKKKAQLIFTSHDLSTMNNDCFRRDEIWFIARNTEQYAQLYSLVEIKERKEAPFGKKYIEGQYGADPYLRKIINWEDQ